jgi:hypothetical protein
MLIIKMYRRLPKSFRLWKSIENLQGLKNFRGLLWITTIFLISCNPQKPAEFNVEELGFRPNILWITCEDIGPVLGCYGDTAASTPNLDRLAREGVMFTNAFSVAGVCAPSRHALITGMYPASTGGHNMRTINNLVDDLPDYGVVLPPEVRCFSELLRAAGYYCTNNQKTDYQFHAPVTAWDECDFDAHWRKRPPGKPFFSVINFMTTHESRIWTQRWEPLLVDEAKIRISLNTRSSEGILPGNILILPKWTGKLRSYSSNWKQTDYLTAQ